MRVYIIRSSDKEENYIDRTIQTEQKLIEEGHHVMNPLPDQNQHVGNEALKRIYGNLIPYCDMVFAMDGWDKTIKNTGDWEMAEAMKNRKTIVFEQV